jgi:hypothetical protein
MAILNINLDLDKNYIDLLNDIYKSIVILIIFQVLIIYTNNSKNILNSALSGNILNDNFMILLIYFIIGIGAYYLIFDKLLNIS